ncbi:MAG: asparaginase [Bacteroidales bacterium]|nr:asparaginase [Bacteroidales bacterium]MDD3200527.1 asparaginase [Bacteroidales bacterium]
MMKRFLLCGVMAVTFSISALAGKPHIAVIATGGTIAGTATSSTMAGYTPAQLTVESILTSAPQVRELADITPIQLCNMASQAMNNETWLRLARTIDSLFATGSYDGVVVTHGTDTMEETAYFLHLTIKYPNPVVITGAMRPATGLSADGPVNLFNSVALASSPSARHKGVMIVMNDYILSADDVIKSNSVNTNAFESPNYGALGVMRGGVPEFFREPLLCHTENTDFSISQIAELPVVDIVYSYANADATAFNALVEHGAKGIVIAGVGHGNYTPSIGVAARNAVKQGVAVVRSTRIIEGGVSFELEEPFEGQISAFYKSPQKARILLMLALTRTTSPAEIQEIFLKY